MVKINVSVYPVYEIKSSLFKIGENSYYLEMGKKGIRLYKNGSVIYEFWSKYFIQFIDFYDEMYNTIKFANKLNLQEKRFLYGFTFGARFLSISLDC